MNKVTELFKAHAPIIAIFIAISLAYFSPVLQGKKLVQHDTIQSLSMQGEMRRYLEKGEHILWTNAMFSGMPTFQILQVIKHNYVGYSLNLFSEIFPDPTQLMVLGMLGVYILCLCLGINRWIGMLAGIAFALSSFNIISIEAGHLNKVRSIALIAPLLGGIIVTFRGKLFEGFLLTAFFAILQVSSNHVQITFYTIIVAGLLVVFELYRHLNEKRITDFLKATALVAAAGILALACNTALLWPTYDYAKQTIRGGTSELSTKKEAATSGGLDKKYAFRWSQGIMESLTFIVPHFSGGGSGEKFENLDEGSATYKALAKYGYQSQGKNIAKQIPAYWGNQPFTSGPIYFGAIIIFLMLFGAISSKDKLKWWFIASILLALFLSWGRNFSLLSNLLFDYLPMYNKFRTPSMFLSVIQLLAPVMAAVGLNELLGKKIDRQALMKNLKISAGVVGGLCALLIVGTSLFSFSTNSYSESERENNTDQEYHDNYVKMTKNEQFASDLTTALREDRRTLARGDAFRSLILIALAAVLLYLFIQEKLKLPLLVGLMSGLVLFDLCGVDLRYLNKDNFVDKSDYKEEFAPRNVDRQIMQDPDLHFRVHDITRDPFNNASASYWLKTIGGYHAAKLQRYQDMIEHHIGTGNMDVLNMLNAKYFIVNDKNKQPVVQINRGALGNAWMVSSLQWVDNADDEINALEDFKPDSVAVIDKRFQADLTNVNATFDKQGEVKLTSYDPDKMQYSFNSTSGQFVVFSEVFYKGNEDWISYIDGKEAKHVRVNYILRGMSVPAGNHEIVFEFKPKSYYMGEQVTLAGNLVFLLCVAGYAVVLFRKPKAKA